MSHSCYGPQPLCCWSALYNVIMGHMPRALLAVGLVLGGFGTRLMMGFSPTVWASEDRTFLIMHICMAMAAVLCLAAWPAKPKEKL